VGLGLGLLACSENEPAGPTGSQQAPGGSAGSGQGGTGQWFRYDEGDPDDVADAVVSMLDEADDWWEANQAAS